MSVDDILQWAKEQAQASGFPSVAPSQRDAVNSALIARLIDDIEKIAPKLSAIQSSVDIMAARADLLPPPD